MFACGFPQDVYVSLSLMNNFNPTIQIRAWVTMAPNRTTSAFDQINIFTSFPSPSVAGHIVRKRSVEAVTLARPKRMFFVTSKQIFSIFVEKR